MKESIFRKESIEKINSPGQLNRYIRVADPGVWLVLCAVLLLLLGVIVWGIFGSVETAVPAEVKLEAAAAVCYVDAEDAAQVQEGMEIRIGKNTGRIVSTLEGAADENHGAFAAEIEGLEDGSYEASVIIEKIAPVSFVIR